MIAWIISLLQKVVNFIWRGLDC